jgi:hypothetical protein
MSKEYSLSSADTIIKSVSMAAVFGAAAHLVNKKGNPFVKAAAASAMTVGTALTGVGLRTESSKVRETGGLLFAAGMAAEGLNAASDLKPNAKTIAGGAVTALATLYGAAAYRYEEAIAKPKREAAQQISGPTPE